MTKIVENILSRNKKNHIWKNAKNTKTKDFQNIKKQRRRKKVLCNGLHSETAYSFANRISPEFNHNVCKGNLFLENSIFAEFSFFVSLFESLSCFESFWWKKA